jgi:hypothetical protein
MVQVVKHLPSKHEVLNSNSITVKNKTNNKQKTKFLLLNLKVLQLYPKNAFLICLHF